MLGGSRNQQQESSIIQFNDQLFRNILLNQLNYPGGDFFLHSRRNMESAGHWIGVKNWTDKFGQFKTYYVSEGGYLNHEAQGTLYSKKNKKYVRQRLPLTYVNDTAEARITDNRKSSTRKKRALGFMI